ncbi:PaaI family thioesterase [Bradyrhizobium sp. ma5]|uniref:PaaI family thioesterase n=1 Tax=Bradyrhizobium sp. ma5 TaxID=3344828 RepID=UPI0035D47A71
MNLDQQLFRQYQSGARLPAAIKSTSLAESLETKLEKIDLAGPRIELSFVVGRQFLQAEDVVHGGAVSTMLDFGMVYAALLAIPDGLSVATINMNVTLFGRQGRASTEQLLKSSAAEKASYSRVRGFWIARTGRWPRGLPLLLS